MKILAFDTSTKFLSIACLEDAEVKTSFHEDAGIRHSELLVPTIKEILEKQGWKLTDIDLVCVGLGPGSFTGLRIAIATVKGLAAVLGNKVVGVPTMDAIAANIPSEKKRVAPFLDARKEKVYTCIYDNSGAELQRLSEYLLTTVDDLLAGLKEEVLFVGDAVEKYKEKLDGCSNAKYALDVDWYPRATEIGRLGYVKSLTGTDDPDAIDPLYLHAKECNIMR